MQHFFKKIWKRAVSLVLSLVLVLTGVHMSGMTVEAAATDITITGVGQTSFVNDTSPRWLVWLNTSTTLPTGNFTGLQVEVNGSEYTGGLEIMNDSGMLLLVLWNYSEATPANDSTITLKAGTGTNSNGDINITQDFTAEYNDGTWAKQEVNTDMTITGLGEARFVNDGSPRWLVWLDTSATLPEGAFAGLEVYIDGSEYTGGLEIVKDSGKLLLVLWNYSQATPANGSTITLKAGTGTNANGNITITEDFTMEYNDGAWAKQEVNTDMTITGLGEARFVNDGSPRWLVWLDTSATLPEGAFAGLEVYIDGSKYTGGLEILKDNGRLLLVLWNYSEATPANGSTITLKAGTGTNANGNIIIAEDYSIEHNDGVWAKATEYTPFNIVGINASTALNAIGDTWNAYFDTDATLPGNAWGVINNVQEKYSVVLEINGTSHTVVAKKSSDRVLYAEIPTSVLPIETDATVVIKTGKYKSNLQSIGYYIASDFTFYANEYAWATNGLVEKAIEGTPMFILNAEHDNSKSANGFVLRPNMDDGVKDTGWTSKLYPAFGAATHENTLYLGQNGVFKNGVYQNGVRIPLIKLSAENYYVALSDEGLAASDGDKYTIGGVFYDAEGRLIEYQSVTVQWDATNEKWFVTDTGVNADVNADYEVNSLDLVRLIRHQNDSEITVNEARDDINYNGSKDAADVSSLRKVLLGILSYDGDAEFASVPFGTPQYRNDKRIERMGYSCPAVGTWNEDNTIFTPYDNATIDTAFQRYRAAGFTLLNSEYVANLSVQTLDHVANDPLRLYLEAAKRNDLGVIVSCDYIHMLLQFEGDIDSQYPNWKEQITEYANYLSAYPAFKGFMMNDELAIQYAGNYQKVASYIKENFPKLIMHSSQLPLSTHTVGRAEELTLDTETNNTKELAYRDYIRNFGPYSGNFTFDEYPLKEQSEGNYFVDADWYDNLRYVAEEAKGKFTTGATIQSCSYNVWKYDGTPNYSIYRRYAPTMKADMGFQTYTAMAYGVQEFNYFTYCDHFSEELVYESIDTNADIYNAVKAVNDEVNKFAHVFKSFTWDKTYDINAGGEATASGERLTKAIASNARALIGCMKDADGFDGYMIANGEGPRTGKTASVTLTFTAATKAIVYTNGVPQTVVLSNGTYTCEIGAGEGIFIVPLR